MEFEHIRDLLPVQVIRNFHKDPIKTKQAMFRTRSNMGVFGTKEVKPVNSSIWPELELVQDFMPVQVICKFHKVSIETKYATLIFFWQ